MAPIFLLAHYYLECDSIFKRVVIDGRTALIQKSNEGGEIRLHFSDCSFIAMDDSFPAMF